MKILTSLLGLIIFLAGIYITYWVFLDFEAFETLYLGLYLGGAFVLMTFGFYLFLLPLTFKSKKAKIESTNSQIITQSSISDDAEPLENITDKVDDKEIEIDLSDVEESEVNQIEDNTTIVQDSIPFPVEENEEIVVEDSIPYPDEVNEEIGVEDSIPHPTDDMDSTIIQSTIPYSTELEEVNTEPVDHHADLDETQIMQRPILDGNQDNKPTNLEDQYEFYEFRVIGIETWSSQRILKKLEINSKLELNQKTKSGINMTQVTYNKKLIGFISRLDMNKINNKLNRLVEVNPSTVISDKHRIDHFSVKLKFKKEEEIHE